MVCENYEKNANGIKNTFRESQNMNTDTKLYDLIWIVHLNNPHFKMLR